MSAEASVQRGARFLRRFVAENLFDLRTLELDEFKRWLLAEIQRREHDPVFAARIEVRDLRRRFPDLSRLENELERARQEDAASAEFQRLETLERDIQSAGQAIQGLQAAVANAPAERRAALSEKLRDFQQRQETLTAQRAALVQRQPYPRRAAGR